MQVKKHRGSDRSAGDMLEGDGPRKTSSCFSNIKIFLISECALMLAQGTVGAYLVRKLEPSWTCVTLSKAQNSPKCSIIFVKASGDELQSLREPLSFDISNVSVLTTLERRFNLQSADVGVIASSFEIGNLALILFVSYFGAKAHRPRLIGCGGIIMALGALLSALPEFLTNQYEIGEMWRTDEGRDVCTNSSIGVEREDLLCANKANTNMMYLLLIGAQVLLGIGATPVQPLGVSYIDDHVKKKDSSLYIESTSCAVRKAETEPDRLLFCELSDPEEPAPLSSVTFSPDDEGGEGIEHQIISYPTAVYEGRSTEIRDSSAPGMKTYTLKSRACKKANR
ncbi:unnamed protein product [Menidia menidia]|uniref:(Atlantic silverside) hypothetical protein n=1 Tax=Menidia menidia TaxID=238744 RepID=A0A8S4BH17_9TELE|nr:unnamed protein product [Menidia menidia]